MTKLTMKLDKVCKNSVRYAASKEDLKKLDVTGQPFTIYIPNAMLPTDVPKSVEMTLSFK